MNDPSGFAKLVPGFDFLQNLVKGAGAALPGIGQWVAPTLDPAELQKRIDELRTVQYWLEQNARLLGATIQALEVQRMTLSTLKTMNVQMEGLRDSLQIRMPGMGGAAPSAPAPEAAAKTTYPWAPIPSPGPSPSPSPSPISSPSPSPSPISSSSPSSIWSMSRSPSPTPTPTPSPSPSSTPSPSPSPSPSPGNEASEPGTDAMPAGADQAGGATAPTASAAIDPMQWWSALTQQFTELAANAMKDSARLPATLAAAMPPMPAMPGGSLFGKPGAKTSAKSASPRPATKPAARSAVKSAAKPAAKKSVPRR